jgi:hypothetical protein
MRLIGSTPPHFIFQLHSKPPHVLQRWTTMSPRSNFSAVTSSFYHYMPLHNTLCYICSIAAMFAPYGDPNRNDTVSWQPEPKYRGTSTILSSCIITIGLCVWTAVHLNIQEHGKSGRQRLIKIKWLLYGLFAPELVCRECFH